MLFKKNEQNTNEENTQKKSTLGENISALRKEKSLTQEELSELLGVSPQAVSKWENDLSCPDIMLLPNIAEIFNVTVDELLGGKKATEKAQNVTAQNNAAEQKAPVIKATAIKIIVHSFNKNDVKITVPMRLVKMAIKLGTGPQVVGSLKITEEQVKEIIDMVEMGAKGKLLDIETDHGETVEIIAE